MLLTSKRKETFCQSEDGQSVVEYALIAFFVSIAAVAILGAVGGKVLAIFQEISNKIG